MPQYKHPPITEAVIEVRFEELLSENEIDRLRGRFQATYPFSKPITQFGVQVKIPEREAKFAEESSGYRLASADQTDILILAADRLSCSRLPPYVGWDIFRGRAEANWRTWKRVSGYRKVKRIGVRYINRIDIPAARGAKITIEDYLNIHPRAEVVPVMTSYAMQVVGSLEDDGCKLVINSSTVPSPLVDHASVVFDIDIVREVDVPQKDDDMWGLIDRIRLHKNRIFEATVTDEARGLFNA